MSGTPLGPAVLASRTGVRLEVSAARHPHEQLPCWRVRLTGAGLDAVLDCPESPWQAQSLAEFFASLDHDWRGWTGARSWTSDDGELQVTARHDKPNTVLLDVLLAGGAPPRWSCAAELEVDPGVFRSVAASLVALGTSSPGP
ncbi:hypothetical protein GB931_10145 [Modestobacter sp. I12A-02628]|uniref:Uncharacterized protein n=1 Tax=Goekera deserti TaxID=2497753 RepID=A0A7K3WBJ5_9ACTN|nr:DUF6228 family protein [Goekera deserti]MPQ98270.1 hypothetical protein [Goekera deserti]NDI48096.1 hypothetical protein [Goekera deserti]NEL53845.1 hypothetical protein [Goekera deserti]